MPFDKIKSGPDKGKYKSRESGKVFTQSQVSLYYANNGFPKTKKRGKKK